MTPPSIKELRKAADAIHIFVGKEIADDISELLTWAADQLEKNEQVPGDLMDRAKRIALQALFGDSPSSEMVRNMDEDHVAVRAAYAALLSADIFDPVQMVEDFHKHFGIEYEGRPRVLDFETAMFRLKFTREEVSEWEKHFDGARFELDQRGQFAPDDANLVHHLAGMLDACADSIYVILGTAHLQGFNFREAFWRVHRANMKKIKNTNAASAEEAIKLRVIKPPGWQSPCHEDLVEDNAHR